MFKKNLKHKQADIFGVSSILPASYMEDIEELEAFYELIFSNIREEDFSCLYSKEFSRPNAAINCIMGGFILQTKRHWSVAELLNSEEGIKKFSTGNLSEFAIKYNISMKFLDSANHRFIRSIKRTLAVAAAK